MENFSEYLELMKHKKGQVEMSDVLLARSLVRDIGGKENPVGVMLFEAFDKLRKMFPHNGEPHYQWTERRIKAWWNRETENVLHREMVELFEAAQKAKEERGLISAARREHADFIAKTARLAAILEHQDEAFHRNQIEALGQQSRGMGGTGNSGDR